MKTTSFILIIAAVIGIALSAPASEEPTTTITPLGPKNLDQLAEIFRRYRYHRDDNNAPATIKTTKQVLEKLEDVIASPGNTDADIKIYQQFKGDFALFLKDLENETIIKECGLKQVLNYYYDFTSHYQKYEKLNELLEFYNDEYKKSRNEYKRHDDGVDGDNFHAIFEGSTIIRKAEAAAKFSTICCKYWEKGYHKDLINGTC